MSDVSDDRSELHAPAHQGPGVRGHARNVDGGIPRSPADALRAVALSRLLFGDVSLTSKVATLYAEHMHDSVVLDAVNEAETLAASLSHKVWQKVMILNALHPDPE